MQDHDEFSRSMPELEGRPDADKEMDTEFYDDDLPLDDLPETDGDDIDSWHEPARHEPGWRRIELIEEDRSLRQALADFDDYDFDAPSSYCH